MITTLKSSFEEAAIVASWMVTDESVVRQTEQASRLIAEAFQLGHKVLICGNGGSACDAMHFAEEFTGRYRGNRKALPAIALSDPSHITCVGNDYGFEFIFSRGVEAFGKAGDIFIGLSTSGNSPNVIQAFQSAKNQGLKTMVFLGKQGGKLASSQADIQFVIPAQTSDRIQEAHMVILHIIIEGVERILFPENYQ